MNGCKLTKCECDDTIPMHTMADGQLAVVVSGNAAYTGAVVFCQVVGYTKNIHNVGKPYHLHTWKGISLHNTMRVRPLKAGETIVVK